MAVSSSASEPAGETAGPRRALVTGGSRGLGLAVGRRLAAAGWQVTIAARDEADLESARKQAASDGLSLQTATLDVTSERSVRALFARLAAEGPLHLCVNNAGRNLARLLVARRRDGEEIRTHPLEEWDAILRLCLTGVFLTGREAAALMIQGGTPGVIVNISSAVRGGAYGQSAYCAAKSGIDALTRTWALELAEHGIRVVSVAPGVIDGDALHAHSSANSAHAAYMRRLRSQIPLGRWARDEEIAQAVCFAAENGYITGTVLEVDGGGLPRRVWE